MQAWQLNVTLDVQQGKLIIEADENVKTTEFRGLIHKIGLALQASDNVTAVNLGNKILKAEEDK